MSYLYGDSTPSALEINYIDFLRDVVEFSVQVLLADQRITQGRMRVRSLDTTSAAEIDRLHGVEVAVVKALETMASGGDSSAARCAAAIVRSSGDLVRAEVAAVQGALAAEADKRDAQMAEERRGCIRALEALLAKHDLPDMTLDVHIGVEGGTRYACRALLGTGFGLGAVLELEIPANDLFGQVIRVERLAERLEVQAPEMSGWLHKEMKVRPQHLEKHHVTEVSIVGGAGTFKLRLAPDGSGPGLDVSVANDGPRAVRLTRVDEQGKEVGPPFEAREADAGKLAALYQKLAAALDKVTRHKRKVVGATVDGEPMQKLESSAALVEKLVAAIAPVVREIGARSRSPDELVLRRLLADDRREEIFLSKAELRRKLEPLVEERRGLFDPLLLDGSKATPHLPVRSPTPMIPVDPALLLEEASSALRARAARSSTPRAGSLVVGEMGSPSVSAAPAVGLPVAAPPRPEAARPRTGTPIMGSSSGPGLASGPSPVEPRAVEPPRRPLGSAALGARTLTPAAGSGSGSPSTTAATLPPDGPARSHPLARRFGSPPVGIAAQPAASATQPAVQPAADGPPPTGPQVEDAATPPPDAAVVAKESSSGD
jgi:hypothetical protein